MGCNQKLLINIASTTGISNVAFQILLAVYTVDPEIPLLEAQHWLAGQKLPGDDIIAAAQAFFDQRSIQATLEQSFGICNEEIQNWFRETSSLEFSATLWQQIAEAHRLMEELLIGDLARFSKKPKS